MSGNEVTAHEVTAHQGSRPGSTVADWSLVLGTYVAVGTVLSLALPDSRGGVHPLIALLGFAASWAGALVVPALVVAIVGVATDLRWGNGSRWQGWAGLSLTLFALALWSVDIFLLPL